MRTEHPWPAQVRRTLTAALHQDASIVAIELVAMLSERSRTTVVMAAASCIDTLLTLVPDPAARPRYRPPHNEIRLRRHTGEAAGPDRGKG
ncbi:hypothetical protein ACQP1O_26685 [Nocardia sp. CA-151230]|uniref:hypothetical protein n=1 Tax=Nocardia sp. CA-151230 TaxID=3239982 RepID=UPI003D8A5171